MKTKKDAQALPKPMFLGQVESDVFEESRYRDPMDAAVGLLLRETGGAMEQSATLYWLPSIASLVDFCWWAVPRMWDESDDAEEREQDQDVMAARDAVMQAVLAERDITAACQRAFEGIEASADLGWSVVDWVGTFEDICSGEGELATDIRRRFWEGEGTVPNEDDTSPIPKAKRQQFAEVLSELVE